MSKNVLGKTLKQIRKSKGLTQARLAEIADANEKHISKIETGVYFPTYTTLSKILRALDINIDDLGIDIGSKQSKSPFYVKSIQIINDASSETELEYYYGILKQAKIGLELFNK